MIPGKSLHALLEFTLDSVLLFSFLVRWVLIALKGLGSAGPQTRGVLSSLMSRICTESFLPRRAEEKYTGRVVVLGKLTYCLGR